MNVCVITGAAGGIGRATVRHATERGWHVIAVDRSDSVETLSGPTVTPLVGDISNEGTHQHAAEAAARHGSLRGWVNSAAVQIGQSALDLDIASVRRQIDVNLLGTLWGCVEAVRAMPHGGSIVSVSSIHAIRGFPGALAYAASKGAVCSLSRQLAVEYGHRGIRANTVLPGAIATPMCFDDWAAAPNPEAARQADEGLHLQNRMGRPDEVAEVICFLLSDKSSLITGQEIVADGGATARPPYRLGGMDVPAPDTPAG